MYETHTLIRDVDLSKLDISYFVVRKKDSNGKVLETIQDFPTRFMREYIPTYGLHYIFPHEEMKETVELNRSKGVTTADSVFRTFMTQRFYSFDEDVDTVELDLCLRLYSYPDNDTLVCEKYYKNLFVMGDVQRRKAAWEQQEAARRFAQQRESVRTDSLPGEMSALPRLSALPVAERNAILTDIVQNFLLTCHPASYREEVFPVILQGDFQFEGLYADRPSDYSFPADLQFTDTCYTVTLYYPHWREEGFKRPYTAEAVIRDKNREIFEITWDGKEPKAEFWSAVSSELRHSSQKSSASFDVAQRNERLEAVAREALRQDEDFVSWGLSKAVDDFEVSICEGDFSILQQDWIPQSWQPVGSVTPTDACYKLMFYDSRWRERGLDYPLVAVVYVVGKTCEVCKMEPVYDRIRWIEWHNRTLLEEEKGGAKQ